MLEETILHTYQQLLILYFDVLRAFLHRQSKFDQLISVEKEYQHSINQHLKKKRKLRTL